MYVATPEPGVTVVEDRQIFAPAFGLLFVVVGFVSLVTHALAWDWTTNDVFGVVVSIGLGGWLFLYSARRDAFRFDSSAELLTWRKRSLLARSHGTIPFDEIERVCLHKGPECDSTTYRVVLYTSAGLFPLSVAYTWNEARLRAVAESIEDALTRGTAPATRPA